MKQKVNLTVSEPSAGGVFNTLASGWALQRFGNCIVINGLDELENKIRILCGSGTREIGHLTIIGHGDGFHQNIGFNELRLGCKGFGQEGETFKKMKPFFAQDAVIILGGCQVGQNDSIVNELSRILPGVRVRAFTAQQRPAFPGYLSSQGGLVESLNGRVVRRTLRNGFDVYDNFLFDILDKMPTIPGGG